MIVVVRLPSDEPRAHHYEFAHRLLPRLTLRPDVELHWLATQDRLVPALLSSWAGIAQRLPAPEQLAADGLDAELVDVEGTQVLLITMPPAEHSVEAHFVAVAPCEPAAARRYLALAHSWTTDGEPATVIGEWTPAGHGNLGPGPAPTREAFLDTVQMLLDR